MTESAKWQIKRLQQAGLVYSDVIKQISNVAGATEKTIKNIFESSTIESLKFDDNIYKSAGLNPIAIAQSPAMLNILNTAVKLTNNTLKNLTLTTANSAQNELLNALDSLYMQVVSGGFDYNTAIFSVVKQLTNKSVDVTYPTRTY